MVFTDTGENYLQPRQLALMKCVTQPNRLDEPRIGGDAKGFPGAVEIAI
jgi:hypothetical protein